ncbi:MAG: hypothetical protein JOZ64_03840 [Solirubrobacterales bacterium]|nr:hypothetical protein [Solirubrobacterales bacterium]
MTGSPDQRPPGAPIDPRPDLFWSLRRRNEQRAKLAQKLEAERRLRLKIERAMQAYRKPRPPQTG